LKAYQGDAAGAAIRGAFHPRRRPAHAGFPLTERAGSRYVGKMRDFTCSWLVGLGVVTGVACGDSTGGTDDGSATVISTVPVSDSSDSSSGGVIPTTSGSGSASGTTTTTTTTSTADDTAAASTADSSGGFKFDAGVQPDVSGLDCAKLCGQSDFSYIWIANSSQSTVSKINTRTLVEEGRYLTRDTPGNPSRTSVSVDGRAVAVANRNGGIIKIWARPGDCSGPNTSTGANDVKPWGTDECVAWYTAFPEAASQRPVAWTSGVQNPVTCEWEDQKIWTGYGRDTSGNGNSFCDDDRIFVNRLDGTTGAIEDTIEMPFPCTTFGLYGGVVDSTNDLWLTRLFEGTPGAIHVDYETLAYDTIGPFYGYGITVDHKGRIWGGTGVPGQWDPIAQTWTQIMGSINNVGVGLAEDQQGRMWVGIVGGIQAVDVETMALTDVVMFANEMIQSKGISVDVDGFIWAVPDSQDRAYRVDPTDLSYQMIGGLMGAYTYSDMTGGGLKTVACNPPA
jgi:hypothetical protein